jgi:uncharacterized protein involved in exopolysaccharide biosynthesis
MNTLLTRYNILTIFLKHRVIAMAMFLGVVFMGGLYLLVAEAKYESVAELIVRFGDRSIPDINRAPATELTPADRREIVLSHAAIIGSPDLEQATVEALGLATIYPDIAENPPTRWGPMDEAVKRFNDNLSVTVGTQDNVITVSFLHPDKAMAQKTLQKLIEMYMRQQTDVYHNPHLEFLSSEVKTSLDRLTAAQNALDDFKQKWLISDYDQEIAELLKRRGEADNNLQTAQAALMQAQHRRGDLEKLMKDIPRTQPESVGGEKYRSLDDAQTRLSDLRTKRSQMLATYNSGSPALATLDAGIAAAEKEVKARQRDLEQRSSYVNSVYQTVQTDYLRTTADASSNSEPVRILTAQIQSIDKRLADLRKVRGDFNTLNRDLQLAESTYKSLSTQSEDSRVKDNLNQQRISAATMISKPSAPYRTARPRKLVTLLACIFAGAILAMGVALLMEFLDDSFTTADQMTGYLEMPVLASFPRQSRKLPALLPYAKGAS